MENITNGLITISGENFVSSDKEKETNEYDNLFEEIILLPKIAISLQNDDGFTKQNVVQVVNGKTLYECGYCHKQFQSKYSLENHRSIHEGSKEFRCPDAVCSKVFRTKKILSKHMIIHRKERPHKCEYCSHRSNYKGNLREHVRRYHTLEKPFRCQFCEKVFISGTERQMHERVHTGEKPFVCELCGKEYKSSTTLTYHQYKHYGVKKFPCTICDKAFSSPSNLWEHAFTHSEGKELDCDICGQSCKHAKSLRQHKRLHEVKQYICLVCQKPFAQNSGLYFHMKSHRYDDTGKSNTKNEKTSATTEH